MWKCKECGAEVIEDYQPAMDEWGNFLDDYIFAGYICTCCTNYGYEIEEIAEWVEDEECNNESN